MSQTSPTDYLRRPADSWRDQLPLALVGLASAFAAWLLWRATGSLPLIAGCIGAGALSAAVLHGLRVQHRPREESASPEQDWTLVRAVADTDMAGIAITDRSGRLVCANDLYVEWFGGAVTPPNLVPDAQTVALLAEVGRAAWRDGEAAITGFTRDGREYDGTVHRVGARADHLLWRCATRVETDIVDDLATALRAAAGQRLSQSGVMVALVGRSGNVIACNLAFAVRAGGDTTLPEGADFAALLRVSQQGMIRFAREDGRAGATPVRIIEVPLDTADPAGPVAMIMIDEDGGAVERGIAIDYIKSLLMALPFAMAMVDREGRFLFINAAFQSAVGIGQGVSPTYPSDLVVGEDKSAISEAVRRHAGGHASSGNLAVRLTGAGDEHRTIGLIGVRGMGEAAVLLTINQPDEVSAVDQQMTQATKMQAVGQLAGGIAHDFNNILTAILGNCDLMLGRHSPGDTDYDDIQQVRSNANRAANLTRQLLAFSRQQTLRPQIVNLSDIVADVSHLLQRLLGENVTLDVQHGRGLGTVRADPVQMEQVIVNLAVNARDAMPSGGRLSIVTRAVSRAESAEIMRSGMPPDNYCLLEVGDTGTGMSAEVVAKIFDPFFTTKDLGKGTGLGLATVYGIVKQSGGYIFADSQLGVGSRFSIYLPVYTGPQEAERPQSASVPGARSIHWGSGTILLVEDEDMVRAVAERALVRAGYTVITASHGEDGLEKFAATHGIDLVISDVMMPTMDGPTMVSSIRKGHPDVPVLFMSGYAEEQLRESIGLANVAFLPKPFSVAQLVDAVALIKGE